MQDSISPLQRLGFFLLYCPFHYEFWDLNKYVFRDESEWMWFKMINEHTYEDDLIGIGSCDLQVLGFDVSKAL